jgi:N-acetylmuramoyl-L-alanine amidase
VVPIVAIIDAMGGTVAWDGTARSVTITLKGNTIKMVLDDTTAYVNGTAVTMDVPATSINDRTMVPLRFVGEQLGCNVQWDASTQSITLLFNK